MLWAAGSYDDGDGFEFRYPPVPVAPPRPGHGEVTSATVIEHRFLGGGEGVAFREQTHVCTVSCLPCDREAAGGSVKAYRLTDALDGVLGCRNGSNGVRPHVI